MQWGAGIMGHGDVCAGVVPDNKQAVGHTCSGVSEGSSGVCVLEGHRWYKCRGAPRGVRLMARGSMDLQMQRVTRTEGCEVGQQGCMQ